MRRSFAPPVGLNVAAEEPESGFYILGMVVKRNECAAGGEMFPLTEIFGGLAEQAAKNVNRGAECKGVDGVCEFRHGFSFPWLLSMARRRPGRYDADRKSTRLNSSHANISYAVFC